MYNTKMDSKLPKEMTLAELQAELQVYKAEFDYMVSPPDTTSLKERKKLFEQLVSNVVSGKNAKFNRHMEVIHELWIHGQTSY